MFLFVWGPWVTSDSLKRCDWRWGIWITWYRLSLQRDWKLRPVIQESTMPMWQHPNKTLDPEAGVYCPGWPCSLCLSHMTWKGSPVPTATGRGQLEAPCLELSWTPPYGPLAPADLHLYSFAVINYHSNSSQWVPRGLLMNYWTQKWPGGPPNLKLVLQLLKWGGFCGLLLHHASESVTVDTVKGRSEKDPEGKGNVLLGAHFRNKERPGRWG